jgi:CRISPR-associated endonuclease/helicase Cas3
MKQFYAHSTDSIETSDWQLLDTHLENVGKRAGRFADCFGGKDWAESIGKIHDLGKGSCSWQAYLRHVTGVVDEFIKYYDGHPTHAFTGAQLLYNLSKDTGKLLSYCIAGHHSGLPNWSDVSKAALKDRLSQKYPKVEFAHSIPEFPEECPLVFNQSRLGFQLQFFIRMLFSCLVDADFLDTEESIDINKAAWRGHYPSLKNIAQKFWHNFNSLRNTADLNLFVNRQREDVLRDCLTAAEEKPGVFSLTVPTGGGKTLASLAFALNHAQKFDKQRIIYVIPFTSIIEQNAKVFRDMIGEEAVLEHHCNFSVDAGDWRTKLASENWDAPVIVTTNVQFFDSFFANKPSKCRKLHNVANSIIIFDEVQAIPVENLKPCLEVIRELSLNYNVTSVLCTATQPAIHFSESFESGLKDVKEIIQNIPDLFSKLKRTEETYIGQFSEQELSSRLSEYQQVLCIVNTRQQALDIYNALPKSSENFHLSALMYPAHRSKIFEQIKCNLNSSNKLPCRVISTQLIEAGVDIDFPCVFRSVAGIDSIAQAAGRCNRNGLHNLPQKVYIFDIPETPNNMFFRQAAQSAEKLFKRFDLKLTSPECVNEYFLDFFWKNEQHMDRKEILEKCGMAQSLDVQFKEISEFKMIDSPTVPVVIALEDEPIDLTNLLLLEKYPGKILRKLQQYCVQIYPYQLDAIKGWLENPISGVWVLRSNLLYERKTGLMCDRPRGNAFFG